MLGGKLDAFGCCPDLLDVSPGENEQQVVQWFVQLSDHPEVGHEFVTIETTVTDFRVVTRATCVHTNERLHSNLKLETALHHARRYLGPACPPEGIIRKDAFRALAIAFSLTIRKTVSPKRVYACFTRRSHQGTDLTDYGRSLLEQNKAAWPPIMSPTFPQTTTAADLIDGFVARQGFLAREHAHPDDDGEAFPTAGDEGIFDDLPSIEFLDGEYAGTVVRLDHNKLEMPLGSPVDIAVFAASYPIFT